MHAHRSLRLAAFAIAVLSVTTADATPIALSNGGVANPDDGFGIDSVTVANVAEPATLALLALGLVSLWLIRRRAGS